MLQTFFKFVLPDIFALISVDYEAERKQVKRRGSNGNRPPAWAELSRHTEKKAPTRLPSLEMRLVRTLIIILYFWALVTKNIKYRPKLQLGPFYYGTAEGLQLTLTTWFGSVPLWPFAVAHDACECGVALQHISSLTMKCHHRAQLVVCTHSSAIHHVPWIKARLPQFCCESQESRF